MRGPGGKPRTGHMPVDDNNDYAFDEDGPETTNGNGVIEQIRKHVPGQGTHRKSAADPRVLEDQIPPGETGDYVILGQEGVDHDGDGRVGEDGLGSYDPNRNYPADWQPNYVQGGAMGYPFQLPEAAAVNAFLLAHPNVAGLQTYHNSGGMILRSPGAEQTGEYPAADVRVYRPRSAGWASACSPIYRYLVIWSGLYTVHGGVTDWGNDTLGILSFSNELWNGGRSLHQPRAQGTAEGPQQPDRAARGELLLQRLPRVRRPADRVEAVHAPAIRRGRDRRLFRKTFGRVPPRFMNEELCHRNMAFTLYQADEMPRMSIGDTKVERLGDGIFKVWVDLVNDKAAPTILAKAAMNNVVPPDLLTLDGKGVEVLSASWVPSKWRPAVAPMIDQQDLTRIMLRNGQPGRSTRTVQYLLKGAGSVTVEYTSAKGGTAQKVIALQ